MAAVRRLGTGGRRIGTRKAEACKRFLEIHSKYRGTPGGKSTLEPVPIPLSFRQRLVPRLDVPLAYEVGTGASWRTARFQPRSALQQKRASAARRSSSVSTCSWASAWASST